MSHNFDNLGGSDRRAARRCIVPTIAIALAAAAALIASVTAAEASAREISVASSYGFADSTVAYNGLERSSALSPLGSVWAHQCAAHCGPAFGTFIVRRSDLLTSNTADVSTRKTADSAGHPMGLGGTVVVERLEPDASGSLTNWVVISERTIDDNGFHSWSLLAGMPSDTPWLPNDLYRFEGSSFSMDLAGEAPTTPEASTWVMMLIGFAGLGMAGHRRSRNPWPTLQSLKGDTSR